jgi:hypothetical protein
MPRHTHKTTQGLNFKNVNMKNLKLTAILTLLSVVSLKAQVTGFKILNQTSSIKASDKADISFKGTTENVFKTLEIIQFNYLTKTKTTKEADLAALEKELYENSTGADGKPTFDEATIQTKSEEIKNLRAELKSIASKQDSLYFLYTKDYLNFKRRNILSFGPVRSRAFFDMLYGDEGKRFKALGNAGINFGSNTASIYSELVSGNLGLLRVSLGSMISSNSNDSLNEAKEEQAYQRLVTYGGNTVLNFEYPLMYIHSRNNQYNLISRLIGKGTADLPAFGTSTEKFAGSGSLGIDFYGDASLSNNQLRFFFNFNVNKIYGTDVYRDNLGVSSSDFTFGQLSLGLVFLENFKISFIVTTLSSEESLRNKNIVAGGQVLR